MKSKKVNLTLRNNSKFNISSTPLKVKKVE